MATIKSYTDLSQSKTLSKILPLESADMCYERREYTSNSHSIVEYNCIPTFKGNAVTYKAIPCWSLAALRNLLPSAIKPNKDSYLFESHNTFDNSWVYRYYNEDGASYLYCKNTSEVDACVEMIEKLHELKML